MVTVVVTQVEYGKAQGSFTDSAQMRFVPAPNQEAALAAAVKEAGARAVIVGPAPYAGELYAALPAGGVLARFGVGHDGIDKGKASAAGILCTNTPGTMVNSVAELTIALLLAVSRRLLPMSAHMAAGLWQPVEGLEVKARKLAVIGAGAIGQRVAAIASAGLGMRVALCDRSLHRKAPYALPGVELVAGYDEAVEAADFVSMHIPGTDENRNFLDRERLGKLSAQTWLINTARGSIVDEAALYDLLAEGSLGGAALDVFAAEPYVPVAAGKDLRTLENVVMVPHVGSYTAAAAKAMAERAIANVRAAIEGRYTDMDLLNPEVLATRV
jgi:phosphoglycerate dehydrogenase-like enzyme